MTACVSIPCSFSFSSPGLEIAVSLARPLFLVVIGAFALSVSGAGAYPANSEKNAVSMIVGWLRLGIRLLASYQVRLCWSIISAGQRWNA
jgi:hypothetical protein